MGKKKNNYLLQASWDAATNHNLEVPTGQRWYVLSGAVYRANAVTVTVQMKDTSDKAINSLMDEGAATGILGFPTASFPMPSPIPLDAGEYIRFVFDADPGATAFITCVVMVVDA